MKSKHSVRLLCLGLFSLFVFGACVDASAQGRGDQSPQGKPAQTGDLREDQNEIARIQKDIARDKEKLNMDMAKFGANSSQVAKDKADLQRDQAAQTKAQKNIIEAKTERAQIDADKQKEKTDRSRIE